MRTFGRRRGAALLAGAAAAMALTVGATAVASSQVVVPLSGGATIAKRIRTSTDATSTSSQAFVSLPGSGLAYTVPAGTTRLFQVVFTGESRCSGGAAGNWCTAQIVKGGTGGIVELHPRAGVDFAFDSVGAADDYWEGNAMERSIRLGAGTYTFYVRYRTTDPATTFRLDDWSLAATVHS
jgi:hypothetical protein